MAKKKGFTLVEIIVVIVILGVLLGIAIPAVIGYIGGAQATACRASRASLYRQYLTHRILRYAGGEETTFAAYLLGAYPDAAEDLALHTCPAGGVFRVSAAGDAILCSIEAHNDGPAAGGASLSKLTNTSGMTAAEIAVARKLNFQAIAQAAEEKMSALLTAADGSAVYTGTQMWVFDNRGKSVSTQLYDAAGNAIGTGRVNLNLSAELLALCKDAEISLPYSNNPCYVYFKKTDVGGREVATTTPQTIVFVSAPDLTGDGKKVEYRYDVATGTVTNG